MLLNQLPDDILQYIAEFAVSLTFRDWIKCRLIKYDNLMYNVNSVWPLKYEFLVYGEYPWRYRNLNYVVAKKIIKNVENHDRFYNSYSRFPELIKIIEKNPDSISWMQLSMNTAAIHLLEKNLEKISWNGLSANPAAIHILEKNLERISWSGLSENPAAIHLLEKNPDKIYWPYLSANPAAIHLLEKNPDKINWNWLSMNPAAIHIIEKNLGNVNWHHLSLNSEAIHLLEKNQERVDWEYISLNPAIYTRNTSRIKIYAQILAKK